MSDGWAIVKDLVGCLGALAGTVPWFRDFKGRVRLARLKPIAVDPALGSLKAEVEEGIELWIANPKLSDLMFMVGGLLLVAFSFLIGLFQTLAS